MEQRKHWWNGKWGRIARKDVYLRVSGDQWYVEQRAGGSDGVSHFFEYDNEDAALDTVTDGVPTPWAGTPGGYRNPYPALTPATTDLAASLATQRRAKIPAATLRSL